MINSLFLLAAALLVFVFGYRFFAKFLSLGVFRLTDNYSTPARAFRDSIPSTDPERQDFGACNRHLAFGHHVASLAVGATLSGVGLALFWGWIPAFLWIVVGSTVVAGSIGIGSLWLAARQPGAGLATQASNLIVRQARLPFFVLLAVVLVAVNAFCALLAAQLLVAHPVIVWAFLLHLALAFGLGAFLKGRADFEILPASLIIVLLTLLALWALRLVPFTISGGVDVALGAHAVLTLDAVVAWSLVVLLIAYRAARLPLAQFARPQGFLAALLLGLMLIALTVALLVRAPEVTAPGFHAPEGAPGVLPWLFLVVSAGALGGWHALVASTTTVRQLDRDTDARYLGYGGALADGALALAALLVAAVGTAGLDVWLARHETWPERLDPAGLINQFVAGAGTLVQGIGVSADLMRAVVALALAAASVTTLVTGLRAQRYLLAEIGAARGIAGLRRERPALKLSIVVIALVLLADGRGRGAFALWPLFGSAHLLLTALVLLLLVLALKRHAQPPALVAAPLIGLMGIGLWALGAQFIAWWQAGQWPALAAGLTLLGLAAWLLAHGVKTLRSAAHAGRQA
ncbi:MAG TPA: carbon starvation CstA family protein [Acidiferrobacterales bacterium]